MGKDKRLELQIKMIEKLIKANDEEKVCFVRTFVRETGGKEKDIKEIIATLKVAGMIELDWCMDEDGMLSGRGYVLTTRATQWSIREWLKVLKDRD